MQKVILYTTGLISIFSCILFGLMLWRFELPNHIVLGYSLSILSWILSFYCLKNNPNYQNINWIFIAFSFWSLVVLTQDPPIYKWCWLSCGLAWFQIALPKFQKNNLTIKIVF